MAHESSGGESSRYNPNILEELHRLCQIEIPRVSTLAELQNFLQVNQVTEKIAKAIRSTATDDRGLGVDLALSEVGDPKRRRHFTASISVESFSGVNSDDTFAASVNINSTRHFSGTTTFEYLLGLPLTIGDRLDLNLEPVANFTLYEFFGRDTAPHLDGSYGGDDKDPGVVLMVLGEALRELTDHVEHYDIEHPTHTVT